MAHQQPIALLELEGLVQHFFADTERLRNRLPVGQARQLRDEVRMRLGHDAGVEVFGRRGPDHLSAELGRTVETMKALTA